jgi:hypothetical protein
LVLLHDVQLLFDHFIRDVELRAAAMLATFGTKRVLLSLEMCRDRLSARGLRARLLHSRLVWLRRRLGTIVEGESGFVADDGRWRRHPRCWWRSLSTLCDGKQLGDALVQSRELLGEPGIAHNQLAKLLSELCVLALQCVVVEHGGKRSRHAIGVDPQSSVLSSFAPVPALA